MATAPALDREITPEELLTLEDATKYELINGVPVERHVSREASYIGAKITTRWTNHVDEHGLGRVYNSDLQVRAFDNPSLVRKADVAYVEASRVPAGEGGYMEVAPDAVVEVVSIHDGAREVRDKVERWLGAGVRMVWVAYPNVREIFVYRPGERPRVFTAGDEITGEDVIPGFRSPVADLFPKPVPVEA